MQYLSAAATAATLATNPIEFTHTVHGMLEAYDTHFDVLALLMCIQDEDKALIFAQGGW